MEGIAKMAAADPQRTVQRLELREYLNSMPMQTLQMMGEMSNMRGNIYAQLSSTPENQRHRKAAQILRQLSTQAAQSEDMADFLDLLREDLTDPETGTLNLSDEHLAGLSQIVGTQTQLFENRVNQAKRIEHLAKADNAAAQAEHRRAQALNQQIDALGGLSELGVGEDQTIFAAEQLYAQHFGQQPGGVAETAPGDDAVLSAVTEIRDIMAAPPEGGGAPTVTPVPAATPAPMRRGPSSAAPTGTAEPARSGRAPRRRGGQTVTVPSALGDSEREVDVKDLTDSQIRRVLMRPSDSVSPAMRLALARKLMDSMGIPEDLSTLNQTQKQAILADRALVAALPASFLRKIQPGTEDDFGVMGP